MGLFGLKINIDLKICALESRNKNLMRGFCDIKQSYFIVIQLNFKGYGVEYAALASFMNMYERCVYEASN